jgi:hypothetical protein
MGSASLKVKRYYGLYLISFLYKIFTILTAIFSIGGIGYITLYAVNSPLSDRADFDWWLPQALGLVLGAGLLGLTFYVISQIVDVQIDNNRNMHAIAQKMDEQTALLKLIKADNDARSTAANSLQARQARIATPSPSASTTQSP